MRDTAVAVMVRPQMMAIFTFSQMENAHAYAVANGAMAPKKAMPQLRFILLMKSEVFSSNPRANMMTMMPSSANVVMNSLLSVGRIPRLTSTAPTNRRNSTEVRRVFFAAYTAKKTPHHIIAS